jgi:hypothetical protein
LPRRYFGIDAVECSTESRIRKLVPTNPKKPGSKSAERFNQYRNGMRVADYIHACARLEPRFPVSVHDITWDLNHGFIELYDKPE